LLKTFFISFICAVFYNVSAQTDSAKVLAPDYNTDSLKKIYGNKKQLLKEYELEALIALSYYPELKDERIRFKYSNLNATAQTTVTFGSIFKKIDKQYIIVINNDPKKTGLLLSDAPLNAQVAVLGHELAHVVDFKKRGFFDMAWWGLCYLVVKQRTRIETHTDLSTIRHGLGWPLYEWSDFVLSHQGTSQHYRKIRATKYMQPHEIADYLKKHKLQ